jgi:hypothetical protein
MEPEGFLPCSQEFATGTFPDPDECSPQHIFIMSILILSSQLRLSSSSGIYISSFSIKIVYAFLISLIHTTVPVQLTLLDSLALKIFGK